MNDITQPPPGGKKADKKAGKKGAAAAGKGGAGKTTGGGGKPGGGPSKAGGPEGEYVVRVNMFSTVPMGTRNSWSLTRCCADGEGFCEQISTLLQRDVPTRWALIPTARTLFGGINARQHG